MNVTVVIPTHPARVRNGMIKRAVGSVFEQTRPAAGLIVEVDTAKQGACETRNKGLAKVTTEWVAFLDSDDMFYPQHLQRLTETAEETGADLVYPWFDLRDSQGHDINRMDPLAAFGKPFDGKRLLIGNYIPVTVLARTEMVKSVGGFEVRDPNNPCEDWGCWLRLYGADAVFHHLPERTWVWNWHGLNTSGLSTKGDARYEGI